MPFSADRAAHALCEEASTRARRRQHDGPTARSDRSLEAAALVDPTLGLKERLFGRRRGDRAQGDRGLLLGGPRGSAPPTNVFLAGHRRVAMTTQAGEVPTAHALSLLRI